MMINVNKPIRSVRCVLLKLTTRHLQAIPITNIASTHTTIYLFPRSEAVMSILSDLGVPYHIRLWPIVLNWKRDTRIREVEKRKKIAHGGQEQCRHCQ